jgi:predicted metal-dependent peptidase
MENFYKNQIEKSKIKQEILETGIKVIIEENVQDLEYIQKCFEVLKDEQLTQKQYEELLQREKNDEAKRREIAKRILGIV